MSDPENSLAWLSVRVFRSDSAWALPRPSATASAKLANSTVNQSHRMIWKVKPRLSLPVTRSRRKITVVSAATTSTTNITGFLAISRGSSLAKAEPIAGPTIFGSSIVATGIRLFVVWTTSMEATPNDGSESKEGVGARCEGLDDRAECERGEEGETADDQDDADNEADERAAGRGEGTGGWLNGFLARERASKRHRRHDHEEAADEHRACQRQVVEEGIAGEPGKGRAVIAGRGSIGIKHFRKAMRPGIVHRRDRRRQHHADRGPAEIHQGQHQNGEHRHLDFACLDLLADIFGRASDHEAGDENREHDKQQHAVKTGADAADDDFTELHLDQGNHAAERREAVMHGIDRAAGCGRGDDREQARCDNAEADFLALHV